MKKFFDKFKKSGFIKAGNCKKCGNCCRNIVFKIKDKYITEPEEFERLKSWQKHYNNFFISGKDEEGILLFTCKSLGEDNLCKSYRFRSLPCRFYPKITSDFITSGGKTLEGCGYYFKSSIKFEEFLKK